jgi:hypothetical protein
MAFANGDVDRGGCLRLRHEKDEGGEDERDGATVRPCYLKSRTFCPVKQGFRYNENYISKPANRKIFTGKKSADIAQAVGLLTL